MKQYISKTIDALYQGKWSGAIDISDDGKLLSCNPSEGYEPLNKVQFEAELARQAALGEKLAAISALEAQITPRRQREALLTDAGKAWLVAKEAEIQALRNEILAAIPPK